MLKRIRSKKAMIFQIFMVVVTLVVLSYALISINSKKSVLAGDNEEFIGSRQVTLIKTYQSAEKVLFYVDESAKIAAEQAVYDLGQGKGYVSHGICMEHFNYFFWQKGEDECYPENIIESFGNTMNPELNKYLRLYTEMEIPQSNYEFVVYDGKLIGNAFENIWINIYTGGEVSALTGRYSVKPSFTIKFNHNFDYYDDIKEKAQALFTFCEKTTEDKVKCVEEFLENTGYESWESKQLDKEGLSEKFIEDAYDKIFLFDVKTEDKVELHEDGLKEKEVIVKFGLQFS